MHYISLNMSKYSLLRLHSAKPDVPMRSKRYALAKRREHRITSESNSEWLDHLAEYPARCSRDSAHPAEYCLSTADSR